MDAVVNRHHRAAGHERRQHVVRRVKEGHALAADRPGQRELLGDRVVAGAVRDGAKILAKGRNPGAIFGPAEQNELGVVVNPRELFEQVADVRADAKVVKLPRVNANPHESYDTRSADDSWPGVHLSRFRPGAISIGALRSRRYKRSHGTQPGWCFA